MPKTVEIDRNALNQARIVETAAPVLPPGSARLRVESFALTANNVTYALVGERMGYWSFFPTTPDQGVVPVWGHATVEASNHPDLHNGDRVFGFLPMASHLDILVGDISDRNVTDAAGHRAAASPFYNRYRRLPATAGDPGREQIREVFQPLFATGYLIYWMMRDADWFGAGRVVVTSASSKTALAFAHRAKAASPTIRRIGLTSRGNVDYAVGTGLYDSVLAYEDYAALGEDAAVLIDIAGNGQVRHDVHALLGEHLRYSCAVGATHAANGPGSGPPIPGTKPQQFFAPTQVESAIGKAGVQRFEQELGQAFDAFIDAVPDLVTFDVRAGLEAAAEAYLATLSGTVRPDEAIIIRP